MKALTFYTLDRAGLVPAVQDLARRLGAHFEGVSALAVGPGDLRVHRRKDGSWSVPVWLDRAMRAERALLLFCDLAHSPQEVRDAILHIARTRQVGHIRLPHSTAIILAE